MPTVRFPETALLARKTGMTAYGLNSFAADVTIRVGVLSFADTAQPTPIRSEASATRGTAEEEIAKIEIVVPAGTTIGLDDKVTLYGVTLVVIGAYPRADLLGRPDHIRVSLKRMVT